MFSGLWYIYTFLIFSVALYKSLKKNMHLISFKDVGLRGRTGEFKEMCKNSISIKNVEIQPGQLNWFNISTFFSFVFANKSHKSTAGGKKTYLQSAFEPTPPPSLKFQRVAVEEIRRTWHWEKITCVKVHISSAGGSCSFIFHNFPISHSFACSFFSGRRRVGQSPTKARVSGSV